MKAIRPNCLVHHPQPMDTLYSLSDSPQTETQITPTVAKQSHGVQLINIHLLVTGTDPTRLTPGRLTAMDEYNNHATARSVIAPILTGHLNALKRITKLDNPDD
ncbi:MAG: hypothetical protein H8D52_03110 [Gammaproteobacteria bacterium]|nr:hypothetical protein [Gammaproteobacteria bacterium]